MSKVRLVCSSQNDEVRNIMELVAYMARVSNPDNQNNALSAPKLLDYLQRNQHWSPFEMVSATLEIKTTRDIARQILRHRSFSFQEFSQRYAVATGFEKKEARMQDKKNRQNSLETTDKELAVDWEDSQEEVLGIVREVYNWAIEKGIAKEQARAVLPEGMTQSTMYMAGTMRSWMHYIALRTEAGTQKEHRIIAQQCAEALHPIYPGIMEFVSDS